MASKVYVDQSSQDLALNVFRGHPPEEQFNILKQGFLEEPGLKVKAAVIGASHMVALTVGDVELCEVFSCAPIKSGEDVVFSSSSFLELQKKCVVELEIEGVKYTFKLGGFTTDSFEKSVAELRALERTTTFEKSSFIGLVYEFPKGGHQGEPPKTIVVAEVKDGQVLLITAHSYPNEKTIVFTETVVEKV